MKCKTKNPISQEEPTKLFLEVEPTALRRGNVASTVRQRATASMEYATLPERAFVLMGVDGDVGEPVGEGEVVLSKELEGLRAAD